MKDLIIEAAKFARKAHEGQYYGEFSYFAGHLTTVANTVIEYLTAAEIKDTDLGKHLVAAAFLHDTLEDQGWTASYADLEKKFGTFVADVVYACTKDKGKNRAERASERFYSILAETPFATFIKTCDLVCNMESSKQNKSSMFEKYLTERESFVINSTAFNREISDVEAKLLNLVFEKLNKF